MTVFLQLVMVLMAVQAADFSVTIDPSTVEFTEFLGEEVLYLPNAASPFAEGEPSLPGLGYSMVIPQGTYLENVQVEVHNKIDLPGIYNIAPVLSVVLSAPLPFTAPHSDSYTKGVFPSSPIQNVNTGNKTGFRVASFSYVPFSWNPGTGILSLVTSATLTPEISQATDAPHLSLSDLQVRTATTALESIVMNPEMLSSYAPEVVSGVDGSPWVVIADPDMEETLQPLITHRNGIYGAELKTTDWIYDNYTGYDTQEQIRNYIIDAYANQGLVYVLIVGDFGETTRISGLQIGSNVFNSVSDLYFSDLDGTWDANNNHIYGELADGIDYYTDVYVGRYSSDVANRVGVMVDRTLAYETTAPSGDWQTTALLAGALLWPPYGGDVVCDSIDNKIPSGWTTHKLYETTASHPTNIIDLYNEGVAYTSPNGHGFESGVYWYYNEPTDMISAGNYTGLTNNDVPPVFHSIACLAGSIQNIASIAERLMFRSQGGGVAVMFNSNNGWGSPPNMGASEWLEYYFAEVLFVEQQNEIGVAHAMSKDLFKSSMGISMQTWVLQESNLLGDPALMFIAGQTGIEESEGNPSVTSPVISSPTPNPVSGTCAVNFNMPATGTATVAVYDLSGRIAETVYHGVLNEGQGSLNLDASTLPSGCYTVVINSETGSASTQMLVLK